MADAMPITLSTGLGGEDTEVISGITLGSSITFDYMFESVTYAGGPWLGLNASVINPLLGSGGNSNYYHNAVTGWLAGSVDTSSSVGTIHDLALTASTFNTAGNSVVVLIRNVAIDGRIIAAAVPEPAAWLMLVLGLAGAGLTLRKIHPDARLGA